MQRSLIADLAISCALMTTAHAQGPGSKVTSVREIPLSEVKDSKVKTLQQQQPQDKLEEINKSAVPELGDQYFGPPPPPQ